MSTVPDLIAAYRSGRITLPDLAERLDTLPTRPEPEPDAVQVWDETIVARPETGWAAVVAAHDYGDLTRAEYEFLAGHGPAAPDRKDALSPAAWWLREWKSGRVAVEDVRPHLAGAWGTVRAAHERGLLTLDDVVTLTAVEDQ